MNNEQKYLDTITKIYKDNLIGDDCAEIKITNPVISQDTLVEGIHFDFKYMNPSEVASKALLANISDILASGAEPKYFSVSLSGKLDSKFIKNFYKGLYETGKKYKLKLTGGDLTGADKVVISITIFGNSKDRKLSSRKNAKPGYIVACAGFFGTSAKGLYELQKGIKSSDFIEIHKCPNLYPKISKEISTKAKHPYAMIDSSDGLCDCLYKISQASNVKIDVNYNEIPKKTDNKDFVLFGGEDYCLVVCLHNDDFKKIKGLTKIGNVYEGTGVFVDGKKLLYKSFNHFSS